MLFSKSIKEPNFIDLYMELVDQFFIKFKGSNNEAGLDFKKLFLSYCQGKLQTQDNDIFLMSSLEEADDDVQLKKKERIFGSVRLIAELFVRGAIPDDFLKNSLDKLLKKSLEDNIENAAHLLLGIGKKLYEYFAFEAARTTLTKKPKLRIKVFTKELLDDYVDKLVAATQTDALSSRVKFLVQDCLTARNKVWSAAFNQFPVANPIGKAKDEVIVYRKKTQSVDKASPPPHEAKKAEETKEAKVGEEETKKKEVTELMVLGRNVAKYHKSKMEERHRVRENTDE